MGTIHKSRSNNRFIWVFRNDENNNNNIAQTKCFPRKIKSINNFCCNMLAWETKPRPWHTKESHVLWMVAYRSLWLGGGGDQELQEFFSQRSIGLTRLLLILLVRWSPKHAFIFWTRLSSGVSSFFKSLVIAPVLTLTKQNIWFANNWFANKIFARVFLNLLASSSLVSSPFMLFGQLVMCMCGPRCFVLR